MFESARFTDGARKAVQLANQEAMQSGDVYIGTEHLLSGLVREGYGIAAKVLKNHGVTLEKVRQEAKKIAAGTADKAMLPQPQTPTMKNVIVSASDESRNLGRADVGTEHLLLGMIYHKENVAAQVLINLRCDLESLRNEILTMVGK